MQTFLPYDDFQMSAKALDDVRLRKQILETSQILKALALGGGYNHHPVTVAWRGHEEALRLYGKAILDEYRRRGGVKYIGYDAIFGDPDPAAPRPVWVGNKDYHAGQRGHLYRKDSVKYHQFMWDEDFPLLYPCEKSFVERVSDGRFRPFPNPNDGRVYKSVASAYFGATRT